MRLRSAKLVCAHWRLRIAGALDRERTSSGVQRGTSPSGLPVNGWSISMRSRSPSGVGREASEAS